MLRPLYIGLPIILVIVIAFVVGMNTVPFDSPYMTYVIVGYVVLFPLALLFTIVGTIRSAKRFMAGGDPTLKATGERTMATVISSRPLNMTMRMGGGPQQALVQVRLKPDNQTPEISTTKVGSFFSGAPEAGDRVPLYLDRANAKNHFVDWAESSGAQRVSGVGDLGDLVSKIQAMAAQAGAGINISAMSAGEAQPAARSAPASSPVAEDGLEGRARIEGLKPYPDGTYDLDLYVTPRGKSSYRVAARVPVPAGVGLLERGQTLKVRIDPDIASRVEVVWE